MIASNIMYVVGQYPRFLRIHWRFLKTGGATRFHAGGSASCNRCGCAVVNKLFEFMRERYPGVQEMVRAAPSARRRQVCTTDRTTAARAQSCETFLKIAKKCRRKFITIQMGETKPFIEEILERMAEIMSDLEHKEIYVFYEALATIIQVLQTLATRLLRSPSPALLSRSWSRMSGRS